MSLLARLERLDQMPDGPLVDLRLEDEALGRVAAPLARDLAKALPDDLAIEVDGALRLVAGDRDELDARAARVVEALERLGASRLAAASGTPSAPTSAAPCASPSNAPPSTCSGYRPSVCT